MTRVVEENGIRKVFIEAQEDDICEMCGKVDELRPYGPKKANGVRMNVCFECAMKDEADASRAFSEVLDGTAH